MSNQPLQDSQDNVVIKEEAPRTHDQCVRRAFFVFGASGTAPILLGSIVALAVSASPVAAQALIKDLCVRGLVIVPALALIGCILESEFFVEAVYMRARVMGALTPAVWLIAMVLCPGGIFIAVPLYFGSIHRSTLLVANRPQWKYLLVQSLMVTVLTVFLVKMLISLSVWVTVLVLLSPFVSDIIMTNWIIKYRRLKLLEKPTRTRFQFSLRTLLFGIWMLGAYVTAFILLLRE